MSFSYRDGLHWVTGDASQPAALCGWVGRAVGVWAAVPPPYSECVPQKASSRLSPEARFPAGTPSSLGQGLANGFLHCPCVWRKLIWQ